MLQDGQVQSPLPSEDSGHASSLFSPLPVNDSLPLSHDGATGSDTIVHQVMGTQAQHQPHSALQMDQSETALQHEHPGDGFMSTTMVLNNQTPEGAASRHGNVVVNKTHHTREVNVVTIQEKKVVMDQSNVVIQRDSVLMETPPKSAKMMPTEPGQNVGEIPLQMEQFQHSSAPTYGNAPSHQIATTEHLNPPNERNIKPADSVIETKSDTKIVKQTSDSHSVNVNVRHSSKTVVDKTYVVQSNGVPETVDTQSIASFMGRDVTDGLNHEGTQNYVQNHVDTGINASKLLLEIGKRCTYSKFSNKTATPFKAPPYF